MRRKRLSGWPSERRGAAYVVRTRGDDAPKHGGSVAGAPRPAPAPCAAPSSCSSCHSPRPSLARASTHTGPCGTRALSTLDATVPCAFCRRHLAHTLAPARHGHLDPRATLTPSAARRRARGGAARRACTLPAADPVAGRAGHERRARERSPASRHAGRCARVRRSRCAVRSARACRGRVLICFRRSLPVSYPHSVTSTRGQPSGARTPHGPRGCAIHGRSSPRDTSRARSPGTGRPAGVALLAGDG